MLDVTIHADRVQIGRHFSVSFERTLRIPDDGRDYPLPPSLGQFPVRRVADYADRVPGGVARARRRVPAHVPARGDVAELPRRALAAERGQGRRRQGQRALGRARTTSGSSGDARGLRGRARRSRGWTASTPATASSASSWRCRSAWATPSRARSPARSATAGCRSSASTRSPAASPTSRRRAPARAARASPSAARSRRRPWRPRRRAPRWASRRAAGCASTSIPTRTASTPGTRPTTAASSCTSSTASCGARSRASRSRRRPVDARAYTNAGLPWFELYDDQLGDIPASDVLANVKSVAQKDAQHGFTGQQDDTPLQTPNVKPLGNSVPDGKW